MDYDTKQPYDKVYDFFNSVQEAVGMEKRYCNYGYTKHHTETMETRQENLCKMIFDTAGFNAGQTIVDAGCGSGQQDILAAELYRFKRLIGINISKTQVEYAKQCARERNFEKRLRFYHGEAEKMDMVPDQSIDTIISIESAHHFNREKFYAEAARVLKAGGKIVVSDMSINDNMAYRFRRDVEKPPVGYFSTNKNMWEKRFLTKSVTPIGPYVYQGAQRLIFKQLAILSKIYRSSKKLRPMELLLYMQMIIGTQFAVVGFILGICRYDLIVLEKKAAL